MLSIKFLIIHARIIKNVLLTFNLKNNTLLASHTFHYSVDCTEFDTKN